MEISLLAAKTEARPGALGRSECTVCGRPLSGEQLWKVLEHGEHVYCGKLTDWKASSPVTDVFRDRMCALVLIQGEARLTWSSRLSLLPKIRP